MRKVLFAVCLMGCLLMSSALAKITYIDAELGNTTLEGATLVEGVNYSTAYSALEGLWGWRTNRTDVNGDGIWVTDGGAIVGDSESTASLKIDITLPSAGVPYALYAVIMNNNSGDGDWDVATRIGDTGDFTTYNREADEVTQALATDFEGSVTVSGGGDRTFKVLIGQYTPTADDEVVSIYVNGLDSWNDGASHDQRTRFDGVGYDFAPPTVISPFDGEIGVETPSVTLQWTGGQDPNAAGHYVYLGTSLETMTCLNPTSALPATTGEYSYSSIAENATYYWQIEVAVDTGSETAGDPNNIWGPVWSFESTLSKPIINSGPEIQVVSDGGTAVFTVDWESLLEGVSFEWYSSTDPNNNTPADDVLRSTDEVLTISGATLADEGYYYCRVTNPSPFDAVSEVAGLAITREVAYWSLNESDYVGGQYLDLSGEGHHADPNGTPTFVSGQFGEGISIQRADGFAEPTTESWARAGTWNPSEFSNQLSVSLWLKWDGKNTADSEQILIGKRSSSNLGDATMWQITRPGSNSNIDLWWQSSKTNIQVSNVLTQGEWQQVVVTFDGTTGTMYNNGSIVGSGSFALGDTEAAIEAMICLGGSNFDNDPDKWLNGALDDVKIYNYALTDLQVAKDFVAVAGGSVCVESYRPDGKYDFNGDCIVNISDFAELAASWLDCGLVPDCID